MKILVSSMLVWFALFTLNVSAQIVINEIMYNSDGTDVEFIELYNASSQNINLNGWAVLDDNDAHAPCPLNGTLAAGDYWVVVGDRVLFGAVYPTVSNINESTFDPNGTGWALGNNGDAVRLFDDNNALHDIVVFEDGGDWPGNADGNGPSLELLHPNLDNALPTSWDPSSVDGGTPGQQNSVYTTNVTPVCKDGDRDIPLPTSSNSVHVTVLAYDTEGLAKVELFVNNGNGYQPLPMYDDGSHGDAQAGDSLFTGTIPPQASGTLVKYYAVATDDIGQTDPWPNNAPEEYHAYTVDYTPPDLRITEVCALNNTIISDEANEYEDWFEIYNAGSSTVNLGGMYVSDLLNSSKTFELPAFVLPAGSYVLLWADNDEEQGPLHTNFRLTSEGESIALFETINHGNVLVHGWKFGRMSGDVSMGFKSAEATAPDYLAVPTPGNANDNSPYFSPVCINEFQSTSDFGGPDDWIEIYNRGTQPFDLSGCFLSDQRGNNTKWMFPNDTILQPGDFLLVYEDALGFGLASEGDDVIMFTAADSVTGLDFYDFEEQTADYSEGRFPDGGSVWQRFKPATPGETNANSNAVQQEQASISPTSLQLYGNYPNPFNPVTHISFELSNPTHVTLHIYDITGRTMETLVDKPLPSGHHTVTWEASSYASGTFFYRIQTDAQTRMGKMLLLK